jgi:hypothetical protein
MSYGMFTVTRGEIDDAQELCRKLELATGDSGAAARLTRELAEAAAADPTTSSWHIVPEPEGDPRTNWRLQGMGA